MKIDESFQAVYVTIGAFGFSALERKYEEAMCEVAEYEFRNFTDR